MKFIGIQKHHGTSLGVLVGSEALDLSACGDILPAALKLPPSLRGLLEIGDSALAAARQIADEAAKPSVSERLRAKGALTALDKITLAAPVPARARVLPGAHHARDPHLLVPPAELRRQPRLA